jgi:hypothetical protein
MDYGELSVNKCENFKKKVVIKNLKGNSCVASRNYTKWIF